LAAGAGGAGETEAAAVEEVRAKKRVRTQPIGLLAGSFALRG
jgi:hypothetical protein